MGERRADHLFRDNIAQQPAAPAAPPPAPPSQMPLGALLVALMRAQEERARRLAFPERKETRP